MYVDYRSSGDSLCITDSLWTFLALADNSTCGCFFFDFWRSYLIGLTLPTYTSPNIK